VYNFAELPVVEGRHALWDRSVPAPVVTGVSDDRREVVVTDVLDATPVYKDLFPEPTMWPFVTAIVSTAMLIAIIFTPWGLPIGSIPVAIALIGWFWPKKSAPQRATERHPLSAPTTVAPEARA
jgi:cytochrome c oxidase subunit 1